ncbi:AMP-dependent synthetase/ligase [Intrasporangium calvum]|uniref:AMP-dependent synthetase and ligase n=1 Tax=Intrasporangium calvum (strain ATCC 23552 / DSM 43043 / JCM 3097 / NBRC 12989 / NCIMB 10167 / NRRL B-3866 / 7 KIP) TaxID=710696 RepID=E6SE81_INTC7|nr:long-chain fatty acid--CoA ligase [Intrasporangium calvum]ADU48729.1 AMP-dependent synthetase and ligase [Intrasporangium calvum DSM 43043]AXG13717.1 long-chain fatty acid--CoA ligase [Intrasporangium calvum]
MPLQSVADRDVDQAVLDNRAPSVGALFRSRVQATPDRPAYLYFKDGGSELTTLTWRQTHDIVQEWAAGLISLGVELEDRVAIASATSLPWVLADLAIVCAGAATTTVYPTTIADDVAYILTDSGSVLVFAEDDAQIAKLTDRRADIPHVKHVIAMSGRGSDDGWVITTDDLAAKGRELLASTPDAVDARIDQLGPESLAVVIYTSGTTGRPKGVRLVQDSVVYEGALIQATGTVTEDDLQFLWLPLSHVFGKMLLALGLQIGFPTAVDGRLDKIVDNMAIIKPTFMAGPPRIYEKARGRVALMLAQETGVKKKLIDWAFKVGAEMRDVLEQGETPSSGLTLRHRLVTKLVLHKIQERFGGRVRFMISGSAPLNAEVAKWFGAAGLLLVEGYGLTETSSGTTVNLPRPGCYRYGSVGWPMPDTEVAIAEDGEILVKGPGVMRGYHNSPEATAEVLDADGWFHTGDIGRIDEHGFVYVTDRKKDFFKTSGGKYIAPAEIEAKFKGMCVYVSQFLVHGAGHNFATALVTLDPDAIAGWAAANGMAGRPYAEIVTSDAARELVQGYVDKLNDSLNRWETIKKFTILDHDLSIEMGDLTPSMKLRRRAVVDKYQDQLDALYQED